MFIPTNIAITSAFASEIGRKYGFRNPAVVIGCAHPDNHSARPVLAL